jgi:frataxin-like iron-binding protein CyaY
MIDKTIYSDYSKELASGKLVYKIENLGNPKDKPDIIKYGALSPSLWIGTTVNGSFYKETKNGIWYKAQDEEAFREYLDGFIDKRLKGDLSN